MREPREVREFFSDGQVAYAAFKSDRELTDADIEAVSELAESSGFNTLISLYRKKLEERLGVLAHAAKEADILEAHRSWKSFLEVVNDLELFPRACLDILESARASSANLNTGGTPPNEEGD